MRKYVCSAGKTSAGLVAGLVLLRSAGLTATGVAAPGSAHADTAAAEGPGVIDAGMASQLLASYGYSRISGLTRDGDVWKATVTRDGVSRSVQVHALTGAVLEAAPAK